MSATISLSQLLEGFLPVDAQDDVAISGISLDSRMLEAGDCYLAMAGATTHGLQFVVGALKKNIAAVVVDEVGLQDYPEAVQLVRDAGIPVVCISELKSVSGAIAARFFDFPSLSVSVVAVTGTDGKTSVCRFIADALTGAGQPCGYIGTLGWGLDNLQETQLTTPDAVTLQRMLASLRDEGARVVALEASSHGLEEGRLDAVEIDVAVLTNFGRDHLDYHKTLDAYKAAKARLFSWASLNTVVLNADDELGSELLGQTKCAVVAFSRDNAGAANSGSANAAADNANISVQVRAENVKLHAQGLQFGIVDNGEQFETSSELMGDFNVDNLLACHGALRALGHAANDACASLSHIRPVAGRMEKFSAANKPVAIVDYAHTPQALDAAVKAVRKHCDGKLWVVFGCGGDRDPGKRAPMGQAAEQADYVVVTHDNPRTENAQNIIDQIVAGMKSPERAIVIPDRAQAIHHALSHALGTDLVLIAGKGHESYQIIGTRKRDFSDRDTVQSFMQEAS